MSAQRRLWRGSRGLGRARGSGVLRLVSFVSRGDQKDLTVVETLPLRSEVEA